MAEEGIGLGEVDSTPTGKTEGMGRLSKDVVGHDETDDGSRRKDRLVF